MDLNIFKKNEENSSEHYWSLVIGRGWIQAGIWRVVNEVTELVSEGTTAIFQEDSQESLVSAADSTLSSAASNLTQDIPEPNKVVFGLSPSWIVDGSVDQQRLQVLKKLSDELELTPAGFVVIPEAIVHHIKTKEGAPLNAILLGVSDGFVDVSLVQNGKVLGSAEVARSVSLGNDVGEGLSKLEATSQYPSRILLYAPKAADLEDSQQNLLETNWKEIKIHFLHTPKVDVLPEMTILSAISLAGGAEVGQAKSVVEAGTVSQDDVEPEVVLPEDTQSQEIKEVLAEEAGFVQDQDISKIKRPQMPIPGPDLHEYAISDEELAKHDNINSIPNPLPGIGNAIPRPNLGQTFQGLGAFWKGVQLPKLGGRRFGKAPVLLLLILIIALGVYVYWFLPKATVTIYVAPKSLNKTIDFVADPKLSSLDLANNTVPGQNQEIEVSGDKTTPTSGTRLTGERAKGNVTITNAAGSRVLKSGTVLTGPTSLKFTLNSDVTVASASSAAKPSLTNTAITAGDIGAQYNVASGTEFSVGNFSKLDIVATNNESLSGGTSREVAAVSDRDRGNLEDSLSQELIQKAISEAEASVSEDLVLVNESANFVAGTREFSNKVGDEAQTLKLSLKGIVKLLFVSKTSLNSLVLDKAKGDIPSGFVLKEDQLNITFKPVEKKVDDKKTKTAEKTTEVQSTYPFTAEATANLLPSIDPVEITKNISGKSPLDAKEYLSTIPGFTRAEISINFKFPGFLGSLPRMQKNIQIEIAAER